LVSAPGTPFHPRDFLLVPRLLPLQDGLFVLQRAFARRLEVDVGTDRGVGLTIPSRFTPSPTARDRQFDGERRPRQGSVKSVEQRANTYLMMRFNSDMRHRGWADYDSGLDSSARMTQPWRACVPRS